MWDWIIEVIFVLDVVGICFVELCWFWDDFIWLYVIVGFFKIKKNILRIF